jgi:S-DNA-T family DNA segregation ATPase FtsK/SpoIIIE
MQGVYVSDPEIQRIVRYWKSARGLEDTPAPASEMSTGGSQTRPDNATGALPTKQPPLWEEMREAEMKAEGEDDLFEGAIRVVREMRKASITLLQRRLRIGYTRSARLIDLLEEKGIVGPAKTGAQQREVLGMEEFDPTKEAGEKRTWTAGEE